MRYLKVELKRALLAYAFWLAVVSFAAILIYCNGELIKEIIDEGKRVVDLNIIEITTSALRSQTALFVMPILATVPFSCGIIDDLSSHFIKELLTRVSKRRYAVVKTAAVAVSSGLTAVLGFVLYTVAIYFIFTAVDQAPIVDGVYILSIVEQSLIHFAFFAMWGVFGAVCGMLINSKCVVYCAPFIIYYVLVIIKSRYLHTLDAIDPRLWSSSMTGVITIVVLAVLMCIGSIITVRRKIKNV